MLLKEASVLLTDRSFLGYVLVAAFNSAMFFTFIGGAPHVVVTIMHRTPAEYGVWFADPLARLHGGQFRGRPLVDALRHRHDDPARRRDRRCSARRSASCWVLLDPHGGPAVDRSRRR